jgi:hypothetical protein
VAGVEQGERRRLVPGHLAVRVVAHQRAIGDRAVEPVLRGPEPALEPRGDLLDPVAQRLEGPRELGRVARQVALAVRPEDRALGRAQPSHLDQRRDAQPEGDDRDGAGGEGDDAGGRRQVVHAAEDRDADQRVKSAV